jgi:hypothetical protein
MTRMDAWTAHASRQPVLDEDPTAISISPVLSPPFLSSCYLLSKGVVPPLPQPVASYMVARNLRPAGSFSSKLYWPLLPAGMVMLRIRPFVSKDVCISALSSRRAARGLTGTITTWNGSCPPVLPGSEASTGKGSYQCSATAGDPHHCTVN